MSRHLRVNPIACTGHGACAELLPELISLDDWGYPITDPGPIPPELVVHARRAADACPTLALLLERRERTDQPEPSSAGAAIRRRSSKRGGAD
ncbi:MAG: ferredoxin [Solirubrobacteraceae bacterium]